MLKDNPDDGKKLRHYFDVVVKQRAQQRTGSGSACSRPGVSSTADGAVLDRPTLPTAEEVRDARRAGW